jgi:hypothetical protein
MLTGPKTNAHTHSLAIGVCIAIAEKYPIARPSPAVTNHIRILESAAKAKQLKFRVSALDLFAPRIAMQDDASGN